MRQSLHVPFSTDVSQFICRTSLVRRGVRSLALLVLLFSLGLALQAQTAHIVGSTNAGAGQMRVLPNHLPQWANAGNDLGIVPANQPLDQMTVVLARSPQQQLDFEKFLADQQDPASPDYHHWLSPAEVGVRFGLRTQDIAAVTIWLKSQGLQVNWVAPSGMFIGFGGTAGDLARAFHTELHWYKVDGVERMSVSSDPLIPEALAPSIKAVRGFYTIEEHPAHQMSTVQSSSPDLTSSTGNHYITPADFATIYDVPIYGGNGVTIGIVGRSRTDFDDFANFKNLTGTDFSNPTEIVPTAFGGVDPGPALTAPPASGVSAGDQGEATLDVIRAGGVATHANLLLVVATSASGGIEADAQYLVQTTPVPAQAMTISFGACESAAGPSGVAFWDSLFQQAAAEGISSFASSGDAGASGCDTNFAAPPATPKPNSPNYICSSSYVTCVGGTEFADTASPSTYWNSSNSSGFSSALSYIPEGGWNEPMNANNTPQAASSGGGVSSVILTPSWQTGTGVPAARAGRYTPDVSFSASAHDAYFGCFAASGASCVPDSTGVFHFVGFSGTSAAAPAMAGVAALMIGQDNEPYGNLNPVLYKLSGIAPDAFHDVTVATSGVANCSINTPSMCNNSLPSATALTGGQAGYVVTAGYDLVTGLGSLDVSNFLRDFVGSLITPKITASVSASTITTAQPVTVTMTVDGGSGNLTPTGSMQVTSGSYSSPLSKIAAGIGSLTIPAGSLAANVDFLTVGYVPDSASTSIFGGNETTVQVTVNFATKVTPTIKFGAPSFTITTFDSLFQTVYISGGTNVFPPTGSIVFTCGSYNSGPVEVNSGSVYLNMPAGSLPVGTYTMNAAYTPDAAGAVNFNSATGTTTIIVTQPPKVTPTLYVAPASTEISVSWPLTVNSGVYPPTGYPTPTGTAVLTSGAYKSPASTLAGSVATFNIPGGSLAAGTDVLTVTYTPDTASAPYFNSTSNTAQVTASSSSTLSPSIDISPDPNSITTAQPLAVELDIHGSLGNPIPTGSIVLTCGTYASASLKIGTLAVSVTIPAGALPVGNDTLTATYTPDTASAPYYGTTSNTALVTVTAPPVPGFTIYGGSTDVTAGATSRNTIPVSIASVAGFNGNVSLTAVISASPAGAVDKPTLSFGATSPVNVLANANASYASS